MACQNKTCKYHDSASANGCRLFPGASWTNCRGASVTYPARKPSHTNNHKETK